MSASNLLAWGLSGAAMLGAVITTPVLSAPVNFTRDTIIASGDAVSSGITRMNVRSTGTVDLAWYGTLNNSAQVYYSEIGSNGQPVAGNSNVPVGIGSDLMGISRVNGVVRIGGASAGNGYSINEYTQQSGGSFTASNTGVAMNFVPTTGGGYATNPTNGLGGFIYRDGSMKVSYVHETSDGVWTSTTLDTATTGGFGRYGSLAYSAAGNAITAYKIDIIGTPNRNRLKSGIIGGTLTEVASAYSYQRQAVAVGGTGTIYILDGYTSSNTTVRISSDNGATWSSKQISNRPAYGDGQDFGIAIAPDGKTLGALVYNYDSTTATTTLNLAMSYDNGATWQALQPLAGTAAGASQAPSIGFDGNSNPYVAYYDKTNDQLHLLSVPEPTSLALLGLGAVVLGFRRRRR